MNDNRKIFKPKFGIFYYSSTIKLAPKSKPMFGLIYPRQNPKMHILQPKHIKLKEKETEEFLKKYNISRAQLPKIFSDDPALPEGCEIGDIIRIERKDIDSDKINVYYKVVV